MMAPASSTGDHRFDVTLVGDTNLDLLMYGLPEELPCERELLASDMAIRVGGSGAITAQNRGTGQPSRLRLSRRFREPRQIMIAQCPQSTQFCRRSQQ
jgi:hypothetical protein